MEKDIEVIMSYFRNSSSKIFQALYTEFEKKVKNLDRQKDENVFQQLQGKYLYELEKQLIREAKKMIEDYSGRSIMNALQKELTNQVSYVISEFLLKTKSM